MLGLLIFSGHGCAGLWASLTLGGGRNRSCNFDPKRKVGTGVATAMGASAADALPWSWKECTPLCVYEEYEFCLTLRPPRSDKSAKRPSEGGFEGIEKVFAAVGSQGHALARPV
jgi:hypothetical protein